MIKKYLFHNFPVKVLAAVITAALYFYRLYFVT